MIKNSKITFIGLDLLLTSHIRIRYELQVRAVLPIDTVNKLVTGLERNLSNGFETAMFRTLV